MAIEVLDPIVANQIAAGEVVNRPASVVKELLENAVDAAATRVQLVVRDAGKALIQVSDNGCGMSREDAKKCFLPHATSKIRTSDDLSRLQTMGFRGEALSSIAAIAQVELKTKRAEDETGTRVVIEGGIVREVSDAVCQEGTTISVKNIFYNTPARRNFLKSDQIETNHISEEFTRVAIANASTAFTLIVNDKAVHRLTSGNLKKRLVELFGNSLSQRLLPVSEEVDLVSISGFVASAESARRNKSSQYFFVNGRYMRNPYFANAVERAYENLIPEKTYPAFFLFLTLPPENIDVNIHPTKTEVKFLDERIIYSVLHAAVKKSIGQYRLAGELDFSKRTIEFPVVTSSTPLPTPPRVNFDPSFNPFDTPKTDAAFTEAGAYVQHTLFESERSSSACVMPKEEGAKTDSRIVESRSSDSQEETLGEKAQTEKAFMQIANKYIAVRSKDCILLIDQHRASKQIVFEHILSGESLQSVSQRMLMAQKHFFSPTVSFQLVEFLPVLKRYGIEMEYDKEDGSFLLHSKPVRQTADECFEFAQRMIEEGVERMQESDSENLRAETLAEKYAVRSGEVLSTAEMQTLVSQLFCLRNCVRTFGGEKIILKLTRDDLDKLFEG